MMMLMILQLMVLVYVLHYLANRAAGDVAGKRQ